MTKIKIGNYYLVGEDYSSNQNGSEFIKVEDSNGQELLYWDKQEFIDDPVNTLGAILGSLKELEIKSTLQSYFSSQEEFEAYRSRIVSEGNRDNDEDDLNHWRDVDWLIWDNSIDDLY